MFRFLIRVIFPSLIKILKLRVGGILLFTPIVSAVAFEKLPQSALLESDFFHRNYRVLHIDVVDNSSASMLDALNTLELFEKILQKKTNVNLSVIQCFDLIMANFNGSLLALLMVCSDQGLFPKYQISELKKVYEMESFSCMDLIDEEMILSQACVNVLLPTHDRKNPFINSLEESHLKISMEKLIGYFNNQGEFQFKDNTLEKQENNDKRVESEMILIAQASIMNKCEIWSLGNNKKMNSMAYGIADRLRISVEKIMLGSEFCIELAEKLIPGAKIEPLLSKVLPWFYYYAKKCVGEELDLSVFGFPSLEIRDLFSLKSLVENNSHILKIKFLYQNAEKTIHASELCSLDPNTPEKSIKILLDNML